MIIGGVEHFKVNVNHFKQALYWKWFLFVDYDVIILQHKVRSFQIRSGFHFTKVKVRHGNQNFSKNGSFQLFSASFLLNFVGQNQKNIKKVKENDYFIPFQSCSIWENYEEFSIFDPSKLMIFSRKKAFINQQKLLIFCLVTALITNRKILLRLDFSQDFASFLLNSQS